MKKIILGVVLFSLPFLLYQVVNAVWSDVVFKKWELMLADSVILAAIAFARIWRNFVVKKKYLELLSDIVK